MHARLVAYDIDGKRRGPVSHPMDWTWRDASCETPTLKVTWSSKVPTHDRLALPVMVALEISTDGTSWAEPRNARFYGIAQDYDRLDITGKTSLDLLGLVSYLSAVPVGTNALDTEGKRTFNSATPGAIVKTLVDEAKAKGAVPHLALGFTASKDSNGVTWPTVVSRSYDPGTPVLTVLGSLVDNGVVEFWTEGSTLHLGVPGGRDLTAGDNPVWLRDAATPASPEKDSYADLIDTITLVGEGGKTWTKSNPAAITPFGRREKVVLAGGVSDDGTAQMMMDRELLAGQDVSRTYTREWTDSPLNPWMPGRDIRTGDWILVDTAQGRKQKMRVADMSVRTGNDGELVAFATVGTVRDDIMSRLAKRQAGIEGGAGVTSTGRPAPQTSTSAVPKAPEGLTVNPIAYVDDDGTARGLLDVAWAPVTQSTGNVSMVVDLYRVEVRENSTSGSWEVKDHTSATSSAVSGLAVGKSYQVRIAARGENGRWSPYSAIWTGTMPDDLTPPDVPSDPRVSSRLGFINVTWDRLTASGAKMPADFDHVAVFVDGELRGALTELLPDWQTDDYATGTDHRIALAAVDRSGNVSAQTTEVLVTVAGTATESDIAAALAEIRDSVSQAQDSADGKGRVFYSAPDTPPTAETVDDLWFPGDGSIRKPVAAGSSEWTFITLDSDAISSLEAAKLTGQIVGTQISDNAITTPKIAAGSITAASGIIADAAIGNAQIQDAAISSAKIASLDAGKITTGTLDASRIGAQSITADKMVIGSVTNLIPNGALEKTPTTAPWSPLLTLDTTDKPAGTTASLKTVAGQGTISLPNGANSWIDVVPGGQYVFEIWLKGSIAGSTFYLELRDQDGAVAGTTTTTPLLAGTAATTTSGGDSYLVGGQTIGTTWTQYSSVYTMSSKATRVRLASATFNGLGGTTTSAAVSIAGVRLRARQSGQLIVDGTVTASQIAAGAVTADKIYAGAITSEKIATDALNYKTAVGMSLTSSVIKTSTTPNRGVVIDGNGITGYNATGGTTFKVSASTGDVSLGANNALTVSGSTGDLTMKGVYRSGNYPNVPFTEINDSLWSNFSGIRFTTNISGTSQAEVKSNYNSFDLYGVNWASSTLWLKSGSVTETSAVSELILGRGTSKLVTVNDSDVTGAALTVSADFGCSLETYKDNSITLSYNGGTSKLGMTSSGTELFALGTPVSLSTFSSAGIQIAEVATRTSGIYATTWGSTYISLSAASGKSTINMANSGIRSEVFGGQAYVTTTYNSSGAQLSEFKQYAGGIVFSLFQSTKMYMFNLPTTTAAANVNIGSNAALYYVTSHGANKLDREPVSLDTARAALDLNPVTWRDRGQVEDDPDTTVRHAGYVVEEVAEVSDAHDGALDPWITRDADGELQGLAYERMPDPISLVLLRDLVERVSNLERQADRGTD